jgi:acetylornithine deacetylase
LKGDVIFQSVIEEERGGAGTLAAFLRGYQADAAIIPEPTDMKIFPKQQGSMWFRIHVKGKSAHGGTRYEGVSAIDKCYLVIEAIRELEEKRNGKSPIPIPINVGTIEGGNWPSSVPDQVELTGRMGVGPNEELVDAQKELLQAISSIEDEWMKENPPELQWYGARWHPGTLPPHHPLEESLIASFCEATGKEPVIQASPWGTDGGLLNKVGGIPVLIFGPGKTGVAHYPNEYIELNQVEECAVVLARMIMDWCKVKN